MTRRSLLLGGAVIVIAGAYAATLVATDAEPLLVAPLVGALVGAGVFARPIFGLYVLFGAAILLEQFEISGLAPLTARTHFFQTISRFSSIPIPISASEILILMTLASWTLRRLVGAAPPVRGGPLAWAVVAYALVFMIGTAIGVSRGAAWDLSANIAEARGPLFYACLLYFLTVNLVRDRAQIVVLLWGLVVLTGIKALQGIGNYVEVRLSGPFWVEAVTAHEDVIFFNVAIALALVMAAVRLRNRVFYGLIVLQPMILVAELVTTRRVAFASLGAALVVVALIAALARPRATAAALVVCAVGFAMYAGAFWDNRGPLGGPVRVVRAVVDPYSMSERDKGSNFWRQIETVNIAHTVKQLPLTGVGLGQQYLFLHEPPALTNFIFWRYTTHDALLWLWLKAGPYGAFALWFLVAQTILIGLTIFRRLDDPMLKTAAAFPVLLIVVQVVFSSVDLGLTYARTMTVLGIALGLTAQLNDWAIRARGGADVAVAAGAVARDGRRAPRHRIPANA